MYRAGLEWMLGFRLRGEALMIESCMPRAWKGFELSFKYHSAGYEIAVEKSPRRKFRSVTRMELDDEALAAGTARINPNDDGVVHRIRIVLG